MFGSLLSLGTKLVTLPVDLADVGLDIVSGGDGKNPDSILTSVRDVRDEVADSFKALDE